MSKYACGHYMFSEAKLSDDPAQVINIQTWAFDAQAADGGADGGSGTVSAVKYDDYARARDAIFSAFPQLDTETLELRARRLASSRDRAAGLPPLELVDVMEELVRSAAAEDEAVAAAAKNPRETVRYHEVSVDDNNVLSPSAVEDGHPFNAFCRYFKQVFEEADGLTYAARINKKLKSVTFIQSQHREAIFQRTKNQFEKKLGGTWQREYLVYHGTTTTNARKIIENGFDPATIKSVPAGFFFATWPGVPLKYGGGESAVLICKVLPGEAYLESKLADRYKKFQEGDSLIRMAHSNTVKNPTVSRRILIIMKPEQILPVAMLKFQLQQQQQPAAAPQPAAVGLWGRMNRQDRQVEQEPVLLNLRLAGDEGPSKAPPRLITHACMDMTEVEVAVNRVAERAEASKHMHAQTRDEVRRRVRHIRKLKQSYETRHVCLTCDYENSKVCSSAFAAFLRWAEDVVREDDDRGLGGGVEAMREGDYCADEDAEAVLYESEEDGDAVLYESEDEIDGGEEES